MQNLLSSNAGIVIHLKSLNSIFRFDSDISSVRTSEFTEDMDELFFWIDDTENILTTFVTLEEDALEDFLEKLKVCFDANFFFCFFNEIFKMMF